jgi:hypothetical protein
MGGPFRAIVGGAKQTMSFAPAQAMQLDNYSTQYGHLIKSDVFVAPGQIGMVILVDGISAEIFEFAAPPSASQAAPTAGQICLIRTFDEAAGPGAPPPLAPGVGVLLPIGLDSPQHLHHHANTHSHGDSHTHAGGAVHNHAHSATHTHSTPNHFHTVPITNSLPAGAAVFYDGVSLNANQAGGGEFTDISGAGTSGATAPGNTDLAAIGTTNSNAPATTDAASPGDSDLENVQHTHP